MSQERQPDLDVVRYFVDEDLSGVGLGLMRLRNDVVVGGHPPVRELVPRKDRDWIPVVAGRGWVTITGDRHIRTRFHEAKAAIERGLRCAHLAPPVRDAVRWDFVRLLAKHWDAVEALTESEGPQWLAVTFRDTATSCTNLAPRLGFHRSRSSRFCRWRNEYPDGVVGLEIAARARLAGRMRDRESTARARELGSLLRRLREKADIKAIDLAAKLGWSSAKVSRIETGCRGVAEIDVVRFAAYCGATHHQVNAMVARCREAEVPGYWLTDRLSSLIFHESTAKFSASYDPLVVPGLLQTEDYATTLIDQPGQTAITVRGLVSSRMERQAALRRRPFTFFVHEQALRLVVGDNRLMNEQLLKLVLMAEHPWLSIRVVPLSAGAAGMLGGGFVMFHYEHAPPLVYQDAAVGLFLEEDAFVAKYHQALTRLGQVALNEGQSREVFAELANASENLEDSRDAHDRLAKEQL